MGSEKMLLWSICMVIMLFVVVTVVDYFVVLHEKVEFDRICQRYFWVCDQNVGLTQEEIDTLEETLTDRGFEEVAVTSPERGTVSRGAYVTFKVKAEKDVNFRKSLFVKKEEALEFNYYQKVISRQVVN
jgi:hypothetical protein